MRRRILLKTLVSLGTCASAQVWAAGAAGVVFDPTNYAQNIRTAVSTVQAVRVQIQQYQNQIMQYMTMIEQLRKLDPRIIMQIAEEIFGPDEVRATTEAIRATAALQGSLQGVRDTFNRRLDSAHLARMSWSDYIGWEQERLAAREGSAVARVAAEQHALRMVEKDYEFARDAAGRIQGTSGTKAALDLMNTQMNRVIQQNAELNRQIATSLGGHAAEKEMQEMEKEQREKAAKSVIAQQQQEAAQREFQLIDQFKRRQ